MLFLFRLLTTLNSLTKTLQASMRSFAGSLQICSVIVPIPQFKPYTPFPSCVSECGLDVDRPPEQDGKGKSKGGLISEHETKAIPQVSSWDVLHPDSSLQTLRKYNNDSLKFYAVKTSTSTTIHSTEKSESRTCSKVQFSSDVPRPEGPFCLESLMPSPQPIENGVSKTSPSPSSIPSSSMGVYPTEDSVAQSWTQNSFSIDFTTGLHSPTEDSSEDHAEIDRTSTEMSADSVRFDQDILDTKTEDEAPDIDDDLLGIYPATGHQNYKPQSFEATEDTDITTPLEMRDSHEAERDSTNSLLESSDDFLKDRDIPADGDIRDTLEDGVKLDTTSENETNRIGDVKSSMFKDEFYEEKEENASIGLVQLSNDTEEIKKRIDSLKDRIESEDIDPDLARTEAIIIHSTLTRIQDALTDTENLQKLKSENISHETTLESISSISESVRQLFDLADIKRRKVETKCQAKRTDSTIVETGSSENESPINETDRFFSDLIDSEDIDKDLDEEFEVLAAQANNYSIHIPISSAISASAIPSSPTSSESVFSHVSTEQQPGMKLVCESSLIFYCLVKLIFFHPKFSLLKNVILKSTRKCLVKDKPPPNYNNNLGVLHQFLYVSDFF